MPPQRARRTGQSRWHPDRARVESPSPVAEASITLGLNARTLPTNSSSPSAKILTQAALTGRRTRKLSLVSATVVMRPGCAYPATPAGETVSSQSERRPRRSPARTPPGCAGALGLGLPCCRPGRARAARCRRQRCPARPFAGSGQPRRRARGSSSTPAPTESLFSGIKPTESSSVSHGTMRSVPEWAPGARRTGSPRRLPRGRARSRA